MRLPLAEVICYNGSGLQSRFLPRTAVTVKNLSTSSGLHSDKLNDRKSLTKKDDGTEGEKFVDIDTVITE